MVIPFTECICRQVFYPELCFVGQTFVYVNGKWSAGIETIMNDEWRVWLSILGELFLVIDNNSVCLRYMFLMKKGQWNRHFNYFTQSDYLVTVNNINMPPRKKSKVWQHFSVKSNAMNLNHPLTMLKRHIDAIDLCI